MDSMQKSIYDVKDEHKSKPDRQGVIV